MSKKRSRARECAVQAIYQWQMSDNAIRDIVHHVMTEEDSSTFETAYFEDLLRGVATHLTELDEQIQPLISRKIEQVDPVERAILRMGTYEFMHHPEIPYRVIINEAVENAKTFGAEQGHRFVNGVMDKLAHNLRAIEVKARSQKA